jgi:putative transposase
MGCGGPLAKRTAATPGPSTRGFGWTGHLFQGRFGAVVMDEPHLLAAACYIALNPAVAGLVSHAGDWPWSSARAHLAGEDEELATVAPPRALIPDFAALLAAPADPATTARIERAPTIGRLLGAPEMDRGARAAARPPPRTRQTRTKAACGPSARAAAAAAVDPSKLSP